VNIIIILKDFINTDLNVDDITALIYLFNFCSNFC